MILAVAHGAVRQEWEVKVNGPDYRRATGKWAFRAFNAVSRSKSAITRTLARIFHGRGKKKAKFAAETAMVEGA